MIPVKEAIQKLEMALYGESKDIDFTDLEECLQVIKDISEEKDVVRHEVIATGYVKNFQYIKYESKPNGIYKFLLQKSRKLKDGKWLRGNLTCIIPDDRLNETLLEGDRVKIWGDLSPYQVEKDDGRIIEKIRVFCDKVARIPKGTPEYVSKNNQREERQKSFEN